MTDFDKKLKELSGNMKIPENYNKKVEELLENLPEKYETSKQSRRFGNSKSIFFVVCMVCLAVLLYQDGGQTKANIFTEFKMTIMDFFGVGQEETKELGMESEQKHIESKPELLMELKETVIDKKNVYLLVQITAPPGIEFKENVTFDYFAFCTGDNYVADNLIGGPTSCELLEVQGESKNVATYVVSIMTAEELVEDSNVTAYFKDLKEDPYSDNPKMLVEGMWSITFPVSYTVTDEITLEGTPEMEFPYINTTAKVVKIRITPLGMSLTADVSNFPQEELGVSDTQITARFLMLDGSEKILSSRDLNEEKIVDGGSRNFFEEDGKSYQRDDYEFREAIDISKIAGIYIEDTYISIK